MKYVFLHGLGQTPAAWTPVLERFCLGEALCPDLFRPLREGAADYERLYRSFAGDCRGLGPVCLCGLSLGGVAALQYTLEHPEQVKALALVGTPCVMPKALLRVQNVLFRFLPSGAFREMGLGKREVLALSRSMMDLDFRRELAKLSCPVLAACGAKDGANRKAAIEIAAQAPGGELAWVEGAGHAVNEDAPEKLAALLEDFFRRAAECR